MSESRLANPKSSIDDSKKAQRRTAPDTRFSALQSNPIFRLPSRKSQKIKLDPRFQHVLSSDAFTRRARVDRYGRPLSARAGRKELERYYRLDEEDGLAEEGVDDDEEVEKELQRIERKTQVEEEVYDPARQGGFSESSSSEEETSESEDENGLVEDEVEAVRDGAKTAPEGDVTHRLAAVNMDWDNVRAADVMAVAQSFCPRDGKVLDVTIYPSEYGRERMEREQMEGPAKELFASQKRVGGGRAGRSAQEADADQDEEDEETIKRRLQKEQAQDPETLDASSKALRQYQLTRLRYYYAVITTSSTLTARALYEQMDGREYLSTSNFFDLRFIPDEIAFNDPITDKPRDTCAKLPPNYKPNEFVTDALTHSKVRLTWDEDDRARGEAQKRAFAGVGEDDDLKAYVGSESSASEDQDLVPGPTLAPTQSQKDLKQESARRKTRALLGLPEEESRPKNGDEPPSGDMQITFSSGLAAEKNGDVFANKPEDVREETTRDRYIRKERERKQRRKEKLKSSRTHGITNDGVTQDPGSPEEPGIDAAETSEDEVNGNAADPFDDPFFMDPAQTNESAKREAMKSRKQQDKEQTMAERARHEQERDELSRLMNDDVSTFQDSESTRNGHFDMSNIRRAEKRAAKQQKKKKGRTLLQKTPPDVERGDDFQPDLADERFRGLYEDTAFAIDPTNPRFSGTKAMKTILEEGRRKRDKRLQKTESRPGHGAIGGKRKESEGELDDLVAKMKKRKMAAAT
ncbi:MAG: hypothetical protein Q9159_001551 [Coniocarpon cinnabarinum]